MKITPSQFRRAAQDWPEEWVNEVLSEIYGQPVDLVHAAMSRMISRAQRAQPPSCLYGAGREKRENDLRYALAALHTCRRLAAYIKGFEDFRSWAIITRMALRMSTERRYVNAED